MAFLMILERLTPIERAVFLLREVFEYEYAEIARIVSRNQAACRQILRRARQHVNNSRPKFHASLERQQDLFRRFQEAIALGEIQGLIELLSEDVALYADGGGKATAVPRPVHGAENVARFFLRAPQKLLPRGLVKQMSIVNGQPAIVSYLDG
ncbi:MAG TPA: sigma factor-like helix-turn-helix DNA-binding protein, partial [Bryobacteraceae bacterium]|nr:sigma factor-like helix-turn-helix DNA-binding protein [Bryobacteraceae bacterium]